MTTDPTPLQERLWDALHTHRPRLTDTELHAGGAVDRIVLGRIGDVTDALAPIIAAEVRKAQADALRDTADSVHDNAASPYCLPCHRDDADLLHTIADQIEQED